MRWWLAVFVWGVILGVVEGAEGEAVRGFTEEERGWWAFQPVLEGVLPEVRSEGRVRNAIDRYVLARLESAGLEMAPEAGAEEMVRRVYFDLHGLPPTPAQVDAYVGDDSPHAYEKLVDRLLASPRYGERWGQHWLDVARYAESDGYRQDAYRPLAWPYRDYVIRSFNQDKPYDVFVREQLAGDEIDRGNPEVLIGTAFLRHTVYEYNQRDAEAQWELILNEVTGTVGEVFLGMGYACAQCHDHKFDPILQRDFFRLKSFFAPLAWRDDLLLATPAEERQRAAALKKWEEKTAGIRGEIQGLVGPLLAKEKDGAVEKFPEEVRTMYAKAEEARTPYERQMVYLVERQRKWEEDRFGATGLSPEEKARWEELKKELAGFDSLRPKPLPGAFVVTDIAGKEAPPMVMKGRDGEVEVAPGFLSILDGTEAAFPEVAGSTGRRLALARWVTRADNPLSTRVIVNRVWQYHFGRGLTGTSSDFGSLGDAPTHPELLDWLATRFVEGGWRIKDLHRLIMMSSTYRQTARVEASALAAKEDATGRLLWRFPPGRLDAEQVRDAMLTASGEIDFKMGGESVDGEVARRSVYLTKVRNSPDGMMKSFDAPAGFSSVDVRVATNTPTQSLLMANGEWPLKRAQAMARAVLGGEEKEVTREVVAEVFRRCYGRGPSEEEVGASLAFIREQEKRVRASGNRGRDGEADDGGAVSGAEVFAGIEAAGARAVGFEPGSAMERLEVLGVSGEGREGDHFSIEAIVYLESLYEDASVRTIASRWNGDSTSGRRESHGWSLGITSTKSAYEPRNLIVQLVGEDFQGNTAYEVVASDLRIPLRTPYYVAAEVSTEATPENKTGGWVRFYAKDLSQEDARMEVREVSHEVAGALMTEGRRLLLGGRDEVGRSMFHGMVARVRLTPGGTGERGLLVAAAPGVEERGVDLDFEGGDEAERYRVVAREVSGVPAMTARMAAVTDFCHVVLNSNEFLYLH